MPHWTALRVILATTPAPSAEAGLFHPIGSRRGNGYCSFREECSVPSFTDRSPMDPAKTTSPPAASLDRLLAPLEEDAARYFVSRILDEIPAALVQAALFGSRARRQGRPDSDLDVLLVFEWLPPDREPHAGEAERIAEGVAMETGVPVTVWSVSLEDLWEGARTPMLVDALEDAVPIWCSRSPLPAVPFTPADALRCTDALLQRIAEGSDRFAELRSAGLMEPAVRRGRDDIVRLCTALLLLRGTTRPRRGEAVTEFLRMYANGSDPDPSRHLLPILEWAADSFGEDGRQEEFPVPPPPGGMRVLTAGIDELRTRVAGERRRLRSTR